MSNHFSSELTAVDLFAGSGAVTAALKRSGFRVIAALDNDPIACETYRLNHREVALYDEDICKLSVNKLIQHSHPQLLVVCAPCQPFSSHNRNRNDDIRTKLVLESIKFIKKLSPELVFFENVPGLASSSVFVSLKRRLNRAGYTLSNSRVFDAAYFGVSQRRLRCVLMASKSKKAISKFNSYSPPKINRSVFDAIGKLPPLRSGEFDPDDPLHKARNHKQIVLERLKHIPKNGGSRISLPPELRLPCHQRTDDNSYPDVYGRMRWNDVAPTLTTGCTDVTKGRFAHPEQDRAITLREAAFLQGFPKDYQFAGSSGAIATQIGNAVPLGLVEGLVPLMREMIDLAKTDI